MKSVRILMLLLAISTLAACSAEEIPTDADTPEKAHKMTLIEENQRVKRYDCNGFLVSDKVERVRSPEEFVKIVPVRQSRDNIVDSDFFNKKTNDGPGLITDRVKFTVDYHNHFFNMWVRRGVNEIKYDFKFKNGETESGRRFIDITYLQNKLPGESVYKPSQEECAAQ